MEEKAGAAQDWMKDYEVVFGDPPENKEDTEFSRLFEGEQGRSFQEGEVFQGTVVFFLLDYVVVDIGYKQEGLVLRREFLDHEGKMKVKEGDVVDVYLETFESSQGNLILSREKAEVIQAWDKISVSCEKGEPVEGIILSKVKGGLAVDIGVKAFLPGSQVDLRPTRFLDKYIGQRMQFKVIKFNKKRGNIVLSRRAILQEERKGMRNEILSQIKEGVIVKGVVKNITEYGAFVDLGGIDGLLHITDMSWGRIKHPSSVLDVGKEIEVKILKFDIEKERISLGLKQVKEDPWTSVEKNYEVGKVITGKVVSAKEYGVFVELEDGIEGLVHVSEMSWTGGIKNPVKHFNVGDEIQAQVLDVDAEGKRISLGLKQLQENPWDQIAQKYTVGEKVKGVVKAVVDFGAFIDLGEEVDALIHVSDISWVKKNVNSRDVFKEGEEIESVVLSVDKDLQKFCLGIKQLEENPWDLIEEKLAVGTVVEAEVLRTTDFGVFVELDMGVEGMIHISELAETMVERTEDVVKKGDMVKALVIGVDRETRKIALSLKAAHEESNVESVTVEKVESAKLGEKMKDFKLEQEESE